jgi:hypothetical protein
MYPTNSVDFEFSYCDVFEKYKTFFPVHFMENSSKASMRNICRYLLFRLMTTDELVYNAGFPASLDLFWRKSLTYLPSSQAAEIRTVCGTY